MQPSIAVWFPSWGLDLLPKLMNNKVVSYKIQDPYWKKCLRRPKILAFFSEVRCLDGMFLVWRYLEGIWKPRKKFHLFQMVHLRKVVEHMSLAIPTITKPHLSTKGNSLAGLVEVVHQWKPARPAINRGDKHLTQKSGKKWRASTSAFLLGWWFFPISSPCLSGGKFLERTPVKAKETYIDLKHISSLESIIRYR